MYSTDPEPLTVASRAPLTATTTFPLPEIVTAAFVHLSSDAVYDPDPEIVTSSRSALPATVMSPDPEIPDFRRLVSSPAAFRLPDPSNSSSLTPLTVIL